VVGVQNRKGFLVEAAEEFAIRFACAGPRIRQSVRCFSGSSLAALMSAGCWCLVFFLNMRRLY
jgi:hypothetical protein